MSVLKSQRSESSIKFLDNAYDLEVHTIRCAMKLPKRMTFFVSTSLVELAASVHSHCKAANSIYPNAALQGLISKVSLLHEFEHGLSVHAIEHWTDLMLDQARLISGAKKSDSERFKF